MHEENSILEKIVYNKVIELDTISALNQLPLVPHICISKLS